MSHILQKTAPIGKGRDEQLLKDASSYVYESHNGVDLMAHVFFPAKAERVALPIVACFHGGFWDAAMPTQFVPHCHHFASRDAVAITFEYRVTSRTDSTPTDALKDAQSAIKWLCDNADVLGIDTAKIALLGSAGGAWLALNLLTPKDKDLQSPVRPHVAVLFSALVNHSQNSQLLSRFETAKLARSTNPFRQVRRKLPPMLFLHGTADRQCPYESVMKFRRKSKWRGNRCKVLEYNGAEHSFFNFNVNHGNFELTIEAADRFLVENQILSPAEEDHDA